MCVELSVVSGPGPGGRGREGSLLFLADGLAFLVSLIQDYIIHYACHDMSSIPAGAVAPSSLAAAGLLPPPAGVFLSLIMRPCLTAPPTADAFFAFWDGGPVFGAAIKDDTVYMMKSVLAIEMRESDAGEFLWLHDQKCHVTSPVCRNPQLQLIKQFIHPCLSGQILTRIHFAFYLWAE